MVARGWRDVFDAVLFATARRLGARALTLDAKFRGFLREAGFDHSMLVTHRELPRS